MRKGIEALRSPPPTHRDFSEQSVRPAVSEKRDNARWDEGAHVGASEGQLEGPSNPLTLAPPERNLASEAENHLAGTVPSQDPRPEGMRLLSTPDFEPHSFTPPTYERTKAHREQELREDVNSPDSAAVQDSAASKGPSGKLGVEERKALQGASQREPIGNGRHLRARQATHQNVAAGYRASLGGTDENPPGG